MKSSLHARPTLPMHCGCFRFHPPPGGVISWGAQGTRGGTAVAAIAITGNNLDLGTRAEPRFHSGGLPVGQQIDDLPPFEIAD